ncbi:MAG: deoxyribonuclease IV [Candidatus Methanofastidiosa archaeon]|nr:deoxyribonuclease IV [Candidatus Methanofastidiosa archaeon]
MIRIGAHVSIAGGISKAIEREREIGGNCGQIFVSSPRAWAVAEPPPQEVEMFKEQRERADQRPYAVHSKYLINLGSDDENAASKSIEALQRELDATSRLGIEFLVLHPGAFTSGKGREDGIDNVSRRLSSLDIKKGTKLLLENTSGRGTTLGRTFSELSLMMDSSGLGPKRIGICLDTCHAFCGGYAIHEAAGLEAAIKELDAEVGLGNLCMMHLNDSVYPFDSRGDQHQHIGLGEIGEKAFKALLNHESLLDVPKVLETPVSEDKGFEWNLRKAISLIERSPH